MLLVPVLSPPAAFLFSQLNFLCYLPIVNSISRYQFNVSCAICFYMYWVRTATFWFLMLFAAFLLSFNMWSDHGCQGTNVRATALQVKFTWEYQSLQSRMLCSFQKMLWAESTSLSSCNANYGRRVCPPWLNLFSFIVITSIVQCLLDIVKGDTEYNLCFFGHIPLRDEQALPSPKQNWWNMFSDESRFEYKNVTII